MSRKIWLYPIFNLFDKGLTLMLCAPVFTPEYVLYIYIILLVILLSI